MNLLINDISGHRLLIWIAMFAVIVSVSGCVEVGSQKPTVSLIQNASTSLANQLAINVTTTQKLRVGLVPLTTIDGGNTKIADGLQETLKNRLFLSKRFDVIEDDDMQKVRQELKIQEDGEGILRADTIHHMGELLGADAIIVGKITVTEDTGFGFYYNYLIDYRLIPVKSGVIGSVGEAKIRLSVEGPE